MKCVKCGRPLGPRPAATVQTSQGLSAWGPVCARRAGLISPKRRERALPLRPGKATTAADDEQLPLEFAA